MNNPWKVIKSTSVYDNKWIEVKHHQVLNPRGNPGVYGMVHFKNYAIGVVALDKEYNTWIVGQYRFPLNEYSWEIPEGGGCLSEPILASAQRELLEETGIKAKNWRKVLSMHLSNSVSNEYGEVFVAKELSFHESSPEETEELVVKKLPFEEVFNMVMDNQITDSLSVAAILKVKHLILSSKI